MRCAAPAARCASEEEIVYPERTDFGRILQALSSSGLDFILIGGIAAIAHGTSTYDVEVVYARNKTNIQRLVEALAPFEPYLRGAPPTTLGQLDVLGEVAGGGNYDGLLPHTELLHIFGINCRCVNLERLIVLKRAAGRPKDLLAAAELEALLEERNRKKGA